jgi:2-dehydropantoate 2-reductase
MQVVMYGAGAVGSVLGGLLCQHKHDVHLVCRSPHADAISENGLKIRSATGDYVARPRTSTSLRAGDVGDETVVFITVKSHHTREVVDALAAVVPAQTPIVSFQNGIGNEDVILEHFENVYGGVVRMTCQMLQPGHASFRRIGRIIVGRYPKGSDATSRAIARGFAEARFDAVSSRNVMADKWLKLAVNTQSVFNAVVDPRDHDANEFSELKARILEETRAVLKSARIRPKSCDGKDPGIDQMIADLRRPRMQRPDHGMKVHNSVWQDLYLKRADIEAPRTHRTIIDMAGEPGIPVPCHEVALEVIEESHRSRTGPGTLRLRALLDRIEARSGS